MPAWERMPSVGVASCAFRAKKRFRIRLRRVWNRFFVLIPSVLFRQEGLSSFGERLLAPDFESRLTCHTGENAFARHAGSGKGAVIDFPRSTGRRAGLEDRRCAAVFQRQPQSFLCPTGKGTGHIRSVFGDDTPAPDFRGNARRRKPPEDFRAHRYHDFYDESQSLWRD